MEEHGYLKVGGNVLSSLIVLGTKPLHVLCLVPGMPLLLDFFFFFNFNFLFLSTLGLRCGIWNLVPLPGIEPVLPSLGARSLSHWTTRGVPPLCFFP